MPADPTVLADRLLDAQVAFVVDELTGQAGAELLATEVSGLVAAVRDTPVRAVLPPEAARSTLHAVLVAVGPSAGLAAMVATTVTELIFFSSLTRA